MNKSAIVAIIISLLSGVTTLVGVWLAFSLKKNKKTIVFGLSFAAGIMVLILVFELIPEIIRYVSLTRIGLILVLGAALFALLNFYYPPHSFRNREGHNKQSLV